MIEYEQASARTNRSGSEILHDTLYRLNILTRNTVEEDIHWAVTNKITNSKLLLKCIGERKCNQKN